MFSVNQPELECVQFFFSIIVFFELRFFSFFRESKRLFIPCLWQRSEWILMILFLYACGYGHVQNDVMGDISVGFNFAPFCNFHFFFVSFILLWFFFSLLSILSFVYLSPLSFCYSTFISFFLSSSIFSFDSLFLNCFLQLQTPDSPLASSKLRVMRQDFSQTVCQNARILITIFHHINIAPYADCLSVPSHHKKHIALDETYELIICSHIFKLLYFIQIHIRRYSKNNGFCTFFFKVMEHEILQYFWYIQNKKMFQDIFDR